MLDIREILTRIFSAIFLSMCTGSSMFAFWMVLRKIFGDKIPPKVYDEVPGTLKKTKISNKRIKKRQEESM